MRKLALAIVVSSSLNLLAQDTRDYSVDLSYGAVVAETKGWSNSSITMEVLYQIALFLDWKQTRTFLTQGYTEANPLIGPNPSKEAINLICLGCSVGHLVLSFILPEKWRVWFQATTLGAEVLAVNHNYQNGVRISF